MIVFWMFLAFGAGIIGPKAPPPSVGRTIHLDPKRSFKVYTAKGLTTMVVFPRGEEIETILGDGKFEVKAKRFLGVKGGGLLHVLTSAGHDYTVVAIESGISDIVVFVSP